MTLCGCVYTHTCTPPTFAFLNLKAKHTVHWNAHLCCLDVTVHLVVQLAHLELQQRERGDISFRNKVCLEATAEVPD